ncbi:hypothetical protein GCM10022389_20310 [Flavobacterium cheonanense]|uniref:Uncharacterized protein n=2 Tax=Flavobacterium cheonanense TaxID=706183 RepID=A0ABP7VUB1_9FLAO
MIYSEENEEVRLQYKNANDSELLTNIRISKTLYFLFSRNFYRILVFGFSMGINFYYYYKSGNGMRLINNSFIAFVLSMVITNYLNSDEDAATEKQTINTLRKMRQELKEKQTI